MSERTIDLAIEINKLMALVEQGSLDSDAIADTLEGLEGMMEDKFDATISVIREFEAKQEMCKRESARLKERADHWKRQSENLKKYLLECLVTSGRKTFKSTMNTFSVKKGSISLVIEDVDKLPDEFVSSRTEIIHETHDSEIKKVLTEALKQIEAYQEKGEQPPEELLNPVPGARVVRGKETLQIR